MRLIPIALVAILLQALAGAARADEFPLFSWIFDREHLAGDRIRAAAGGKSADLVIGGRPLFVGGGPGAGGRGEALGAIALDGRTQYLRAAPDVSSFRFPRASMTIEARAFVVRSGEWCAFLGGLQDNGDFERGFALGLHGERAVFGLATRSTGRLTYLESKGAFPRGSWHHLAGTYDGEKMRLYLDGRLDGEAPASGEILPAPSGFLEAGAYHDDDELYRFEGLLREAAIFEPALSAAAIEARSRAASENLPGLPRELYGPFLEVDGPFVEFSGRERVEIRWESEAPEPSAIEIEVDGGASPPRRVEDAKELLTHTLALDGIRGETIYRFRIRGTAPGGSPLPTRWYEFDGSPAATPPPEAPVLPCPYPEDALSERYREAARRIVERSGVTRGYALVLDAGEGRLAYELAKLTRLSIVALEPSPEKAARARSALDRAGLHGSRVSVHSGDLSSILYGPYFANLIVSDRMLVEGALPSESSAAVYRLLRPSGGVLCLNSPLAGGRSLSREALERYLAPSGADGARSSFEGDGGTFLLHRRGPLQGAGEWTHQYGSASNSSTSMDELVEGDLDVLWFGRPGARPMPDRGPRNPAPLYADGRLFVQGNRILFGLDAYNGTVLWNFQAPAYRRANLPRDSSNMAVAGDRLYLAGGARCWAIDAQTGERKEKFSLPAAAPSGPACDWGFLAATNELLLGSATPKEGIYIGDDGEWYEESGPLDIGKVTSERLFAYDPRPSDPHPGRLRWSYEKGVIVNSTITLSGERILFVECRDPALKPNRSGRLSGDLPPKAHLVSLDLATGAERWSAEFDFSKCYHMLYLAASGDTVLAVGSDRSKGFHTYAFHASNGYLLWENTAPAQKTHHSGHLSHPVLLEDKIYVNKHTFDRATGKILAVDTFDYHGCGVMSASRRTIFHRYEYQGMWDLKTNTRKELLGVRSGCWLGMIPAGGLLLAPETSSGCSCTHAIQTSVAYVPRGQTPAFEPAGRDFTGEIAVEIRSPVPGAEVRYTLDGSNPAPSSPVASGPVRIDHTVKVTAGLFRGGVPLGGFSSTRYVRTGG